MTRSVLLVAFLVPTVLYAQGANGGGGNAPAGGSPAAASGGSGGKTETRSTTDSDEDDFKQTPYTRFGEFQSDDEEAEDARFFQFGRFFGVGLGAGFEGATGNRGTLYQGGFPTLEAKVVYWFDFQTSMVLSIMNSKHSFSGILDPNGGNTESARYDVNIMRIGADFRYYADTKDLSAPITFANPYFTAGIGNYRMTQTQLGGDDSSKIEDSSFGFAMGGGFEFIMQPKKSYFNLEARIHSVSFSNSGTEIKLTGDKVLTGQDGLFFTLMGSILFTW